MPAEPANADQGALGNVCDAFVTHITAENNEGRRVSAESLR